MGTVTTSRSATRLVEEKMTWVCHGGLGTPKYSHTLAAFDQAISKGCLHLSTNLYCSLDDHLLTAPGDKILVGGNPLPLHSLTRKNIESLFGNAEFRLLFLDEFLNRYAGIDWTLHLPPQGGVRIAKQLLAWAIKNQSVHWLKSQGRLAVHDKTSLTYLQSAIPEMKVVASPFKSLASAFQAKFPLPWKLGGLEGQTVALPIFLNKVKILTPESVSRLKRAGAKILIIADPPFDWLLFRRLQVDDILTKDSSLENESLRGLTKGT